MINHEQNSIPDKERLVMGTFDELHDEQGREGGEGVRPGLA
jgi:hypothetical protein